MPVAITRTKYTVLGYSSNNLAISSTFTTLDAVKLAETVTLLIALISTGQVGDTAISTSTSDSEGLTTFIAKSLFTFLSADRSTLYHTVSAFKSITMLSEIIRSIAFSQPSIGISGLIIKSPVLFILK